jgi:pyridinium-3,5-bisthiocarboxylic acid mononucleotide nickel chelatase
MIGYFDCQSGASGDMILGAIIDAGLPLEQLQQSIDLLDIGARLRHERVMRCGISSSRVEVEIDGQPVQETQEHHLSAETISGTQHKHPHEHKHSADGHHPDPGEPATDGTESHGTHSHSHSDHHHDHIRVSALLEQIDRSGLADEIKETATEIYRRLATAEASVHGADVDTVGLHEVGSADALVDIVGAVAGLKSLGVTQIFSSALHCGSGTVRCAHGRYPVPVPGVVALCQGVPMVQTDVPAELLTPTGAAILTTICAGYGRACPPLTLQGNGYGAGRRDLEGRPNVLRLRLGVAVEGTSDSDCVLIDANLDDMNPEIFSFLFDRLFESGARDVFVTPILMKKGRPGHLLSVLCDPVDVEPLTKIVLSETTTLGVRTHGVTRQILPRTWETVATPFGDVRVKVTSVDGRNRGAPEYEDCARLAKQLMIPILSVYTAAMAAHSAKQPTS